MTKINRNLPTLNTFIDSKKVVPIADLEQKIRSLINDDTLAIEIVALIQRAYIGVYEIAFQEGYSHCYNYGWVDTLEKDTNYQQKASFIDDTED